MSDDKDPQRISDAADNCEVLRARLAKYEDAEGNPISTIAEQAREIERLKAWKSEEIEVMTPLLDYARSVCAGPLGCSLSEWLVEDHKRLAALKAQPSGVVLADDIRAAYQNAVEVFAEETNAAQCREVAEYMREVLLARLNSSPVSACWMMPTAQQLEQALESVPSFHDLSAELIAPAMLEHLRDVISAGEFGDAYQGAREDLAIWKRRALEAEAKIREQDQIIENLGNALNDENGPTFMGEPVMPASAGDDRKLSDIGNELHNLSCHVVHHNEGWANQLGTLASELWNWQARVALTAGAPSHGEQVRDRYTCIGKGGNYQLLGLAQGAGTLKGFNHMVYRNIDGVMFVRDPEDFLMRMEKIAAAPSAGSQKEQGE